MPTFMRGARPTPKHKLLAAAPYRVTAAPLPQFAVVPKQLDMWGNSQYGDCVSAEEAFAKAWWSTYCGLPETFIPAADVIAFARRYGYLNGATLTDVMDTMISQGMASGGQVYKDGAYAGVDYSNEFVLQAAIDPTDGTGGPVKIAIDANALPSGAGNQQGWYATSGGHYPNTDHCVSLGSYGPAGFLYDALKVQLPSGLSPSTPGYLLFTWSTLGFVTHDWLMGTCTEAWVRNPTTPGQSPAPVPPSPPPPPVPPVPPSLGYVQSAPYTFTTGTWPFHSTVTIPGQTLPVLPGPVPAAAVSYAAGTDFGAVKWPGLLTVLGDASAVFLAVQSQNWEAVVQAVLKTLADFGVAVTSRPPTLGAIPAFGPVLADLRALVAAVWSRDLAGAEAALRQLAADVGL